MKKSQVEGFYFSTGKNLLPVDFLETVIDPLAKIWFNILEVNPC